MTKHTIICLTALVLLSTAAESSAQATAQAPSDSDQARELFARALPAMNAHDFEKARPLLRRALELMPSFDIAGSLGQAELELGMYRDAAEHLSLSLRQFPPSESRKLKQKVEAGLAEAKRHVGELELEVEPEGAEVLLDGKMVGTAPLENEVYVAPGPHIVEARLASGELVSQSLQAVAGEKHSVNLQVVPAGATASPMALSERTSAERQPESGAETDALASDKSLVPVYVGAGLTAVGLGAWIGFGIAASNARDDADAIRVEIAPDACTTNAASPERCTEAEAVYDRQRRNGTLSRVGMGVTLVSSVATLGYLLFWPKSAPYSSTAGVQPALAVDSTGATAYLRGLF